MERSTSQRLNTSKGRGFHDGFDGGAELQAQNNLAVATGTIPTGLVAVFRALGGGWQIRDGNGFVTAAMSEEMRRRTDWGQLLPAAGKAPLPAPCSDPDRGSDSRPLVVKHKQK
jgi:hypothetical protein